MNKRPLTVSVALALVLLNALIWLSLGLIIAINAHPALPDNPLYKGILATMSLVAGCILVGLFFFLGQPRRPAYYFTIVFLLASAFLTVFDDFGLTDLAVVLLNIAPVLFLIKDRDWYLQTGLGEIGV